MIRKAWRLVFMVIWSTTIWNGGLISFADIGQASGERAEAEVLVAEAIFLYDDQRYEDALRILTRALEIAPDHPRGLYYKGLAHLSLKQPEQAIAPLEKLYTLQPKDANAQSQLGSAYFLLQNYEKAQPLLEEAYRQQPDLSNLAYYVGYLRFQQGNYQHALEAFKTLKTSDPDVAQLTAFYKGLALGVLGLPEQAIAELELIPREDPTATISGPALRLRDSLAAQQTPEKHFRAQVSVGGFYDDNVAINPNSSNTGNAAVDTSVNLLHSRKTTAPGIVASALGEYSFYRRGPTELTLMGSFFQTINLNDGLKTFNIQDYLGGVAANYRGTLAKTIPYQLALQYTYDYLLLDQNGFLSRHVMTFAPTVLPPSFTLPYIGTVNNAFSPLLRYQIQSFFREFGDSDPRFGSDIRDGYNTAVGFLHLFRMQNDKHIVRIGYQYDIENTKGTSFSYSGNRFLVGGQTLLPWGRITLRYDYDVHFRAYENPQSLFLNDEGVFAQRYDIQQTQVMQVIKPLAKNFTLTFQYQRIRNDSNVPVYDFTKNVWTTLVSWNY